MAYLPRAERRGSTLRLLSRSSVAGLSIVCTLLASSCRDATEPGSPVVQLSTHTAAIAVGDSAELTLLPALPPGYVPAVTWSSSDPATVSVRGSGSGAAIVRGLRLGQATIRVSGRGMRDSAAVRVVSLTPAEHYLQTLSLWNAERVDIVPEGAIPPGSISMAFDSMPVVSSPAIRFVGMDVWPVYTPGGGEERVHVYHFLASAPGRSVVTIRYADGRAAFQDTLNVRAAVPHGAFAQVSAGFFPATCGVTTTGAAFCWGSKFIDDDVGPGQTIIHDTPTPIGAQLVFANVSVGGRHACGVTTGGAAYCWGENINGELGDGTTTPASAPVRVAGGLDFKTVSAGIYHTCGLTTAGVIYCWGNNFNGEVGNPAATTYTNSTPLPVSSDSTFVAVAVGYQYSCGLTTGGTAYCWGLNAYGEFGNGKMISTAVPVPAAGGLNFAGLSAGYFHACALDRAGAAYCWGTSFEGEVGNGSPGESSSSPPTDTVTSPAPVSGGLTFATISAGQWATCGVASKGTYCWGYNGRGQLGAATPYAANPAPVRVFGGLTFSSISTGYSHTCGVTTQGVAYCWGDNSGGDLGDGSWTRRSTPVPVLGP